MDPKRTREAVRIPRCKERSCDADEVREDRDANCENKGGTVGEYNKDGPPEPAGRGVGVEMM